MNVQKGPWGSIDLNFVSPILLYDYQLILPGAVRGDTTCPEGLTLSYYVSCRLPPSSPPKSTFRRLLQKKATVRLENIIQPEFRLLFKSVFDIECRFYYRFYLPRSAERQNENDLKVPY